MKLKAAIQVAEWLNKDASTPSEALKTGSKQFKIEYKICSVA